MHRGISKLIIMAVDKNVPYVCSKSLLGWALVSRQLVASSITSNDDSVIKQHIKKIELWGDEGQNKRNPE